MQFHPTDALLGKPIHFNQLELNDLVRDLYLSKQYMLELLTSRFTEKIVQSHGTCVTYYCGQGASFQLHFIGQLIYCKDIKGLLLENGVTYMSGD